MSDMPYIIVRPCGWCGAIVLETISWSPRDRWSELEVRHDQGDFSYDCCPTCHHELHPVCRVIVPGGIINERGEGFHPDVLADVARAKKS